LGVDPFRDLRELARDARREVYPTLLEEAARGLEQDTEFEPDVTTPPTIAPVAIVPTTAAHRPGAQAVESSEYSEERGARVDAVDGIQDGRPCRGRQPQDVFISRLQVEGGRPHGWARTTAARGRSRPCHVT